LAPLRDERRHFVARHMLGPRGITEVCPHHLTRCDVAQIGTRGVRELDALRQVAVDEVTKGNGAFRAHIKELPFSDCCLALSEHEFRLALTGANGFPMPFAVRKILNAPACGAILVWPFIESHLSLLLLG